MEKWPTMELNYPSMDDLFGPGLNEPGDYPQGPDEDDEDD